MAAKDYLPTNDMFLVRGQSLTLSQCAKWDFDHGARTQLTGWGRVCKDRRERGVSRKQRRQRQAT